jgi:hypothetical protein
MRLRESYDIARMNLCHLAFDDAFIVDVCTCHP